MLRALALGCVAVGLLSPASVANAAPSVEEIQQQIQKSSAELTKIVEEYNTTNVMLARTRTAATEAAARLAPLQSQLDDAAASVDELAVTAYTTGQLSTISALLDSGSSGQLLSRMSALDQMARVRNSQVTEALDARTKVEEEKAKLDTLLATQTVQQQTLAAKKTQIEKDLARLYELRRQAYGAATETASGSTAVAPSVSGAAGVAVKYAYGALGKPYVWAADGPDGYDCSGLTLAAWRAAGKSLSHSSSIQYQETARISRSQLQPGDLVFYNSLGHVAIYVGSNQIIHSPTFGEVVKLASVDMMTPYGYGRVR